MIESQLYKQDYYPYSLIVARYIWGMSYYTPSGFYIIRAMQIDSSNFDQHLDFILAEIESAHFVAFDCEFTGLVTQLEHMEGLFPDHREFYQRVKETALNFSLLQLGITLFHFNEGEYAPRAYNFYVSAPNRARFNKLFVAEWESMAFLAKNGMDFSHAFRNGIQYRRLFQSENEQQIGLCNPLEQRNYGPDTVFFGREDRETIDRIEKIVGSEERARVDFGSKRVLDFFRGKYEMSYDKTKKNMERYEYDVRVFRNEEIEFAKQQSKKEEEAVQLCENKEDITLEEKKPVHARTLQAVIEKIIACGKPLVGHFPNLDLGLIYHSFIAPLPQTFEQFTAQINKLFPFIFDTKVLSRRLQNRMKSIKVDLKSLYKACFNKKLLQPYANINYKHVEAYIQSDSSHEAGFDSFMTGCAFIAMLNYLYENKHIPFVFPNAQKQNKILYSKFVGEVSLFGPEFTPKTQEYLSKIIIFPGSMKSHDYKALGDILCQIGTLSVHQDHGETYYVFDEPQDIGTILAQLQGLKDYSQRRIVAGRNLWA